MSYSRSEIETMRHILARETNKHPQGPPREFDLNNPPKAPYSHQEYPKMVYHHKHQKTLTVNDEKEEHQANREGFKAKAFVAETTPTEIPLTPELQKALDTLDTEARKPKQE